MIFQRHSSPRLCLLCQPKDRNISLALKPQVRVWMGWETPSTSSSSWDSLRGPLRVSWKRIFFILRYCRLSSSLTAFLVLWIRSSSTLGGRSRRTKSCWVQGDKTPHCRLGLNQGQTPEVTPPILQLICSYSITANTLSQRLQTHRACAGVRFSELSRLHRWFVSSWVASLKTHKVTLQTLEAQEWTECIQNKEESTCKDLSCIHLFQFTHKTSKETTKFIYT